MSWNSAGGASFEEISADYPSLEREDILAAGGYAHQASFHWRQKSVIERKLTQTAPGGREFFSLSCFSRRLMHRLKLQCCKQNRDHKLGSDVRSAYYESWIPHRLEIIRCFEASDRFVEIR